MFDRLEKDLKEALAAIDASSEHLEKARRMDISQIPVRTELLESSVRPCSRSISRVLTVRTRARRALTLQPPSSLTCNRPWMVSKARM